jgi:hypothetical protein
MPLNRRTSSILDQFPPSTIRESVGPQSHTTQSPESGGRESGVTLKTHEDVRSSGRLIGG